MTASDTKSLSTIGFLTVVEDEQHGFVGGYLVLSAAGRPLEFHCTAPVRPNQAQTILYGPTLREYLCGEQIAAALVKHAQVEPAIVCTDLPEVLALSPHVAMPVVMIGSAMIGEASSAPAGTNMPLEWFELKCSELPGQRAAVSAEPGRERERVLASWPAAARLDLQEPFERIRMAIREAQRMAA